MTKTVSGELEDRQSLAMSMDGEEYQSQLLTKPEFGCVQFEAGRSA